MADFPLISPATSRVVEFQRGLGDEKRRQDRADFTNSLPSGQGAEELAAKDAAASSSGAAGADASFASRANPQDSLSQKTESSASDIRSRLASVGFSAQQISQESGGEAAGTAGNPTAEAAKAYGSTQRRGDGGQTPTGPQIVTESGFISGFGKFDSLPRLNLTA